MASTTEQHDFERSSESGNSGNLTSYDHSGKHDSDTISEKERIAELERIHTFERVGTHAAYYEKDGLRTMGDGMDHEPHKKVSCS